MIHDAAVVKNFLENSTTWGVFIPCDNRKEATGTAQTINSLIREGEKQGQRNGAIGSEPEVPPQVTDAGTD